MPDDGSYGPETYGDRVAEVYDTLFPDPTQTRGAAELEILERLAEGAGPALESGIGTGRIALPLRERGAEVEEIDASSAMIAKLWAKPGGTELVVHEGSFAEFELAGRYSLIYVVFNTFFALLTQADQISCFRSVAQHLMPDGVFALEAFVPDLNRYRQHQSAGAYRVELDEAWLDLAVHDPVKQQIRVQQIQFKGGTQQMYQIELRYAWPSELDLMAQLAGLTRRERWGGWGRQPFDADSQKHVSVFGRA